MPIGQDYHAVRQMEKPQRLKVALYALSVFKDKW
jgi:hypothetical protein